MPNTEPMRYDQFSQFSNPTGETFIGRWDGEDYEIPAGGSLMIPLWLCKHFAKRLTDEVMIKRHNTPLRDNDERRMSFLAECLGEDVAASTLDTQPGQVKPPSMRDQIMAQQKTAVPGSIHAPQAPAPDKPYAFDPFTGQPITDSANTSTPPDETSSLPPAPDEIVEDKSEVDLQKEIAEEAINASKGMGLTNRPKASTPSDDDDVGPAEFEGDASNVGMPAAMQSDLEGPAQ